MTEADPEAASMTDRRGGATGATSPPGPRGLPVLGSTLSVARDPVAFLTSLREYGDVVRYEALGREFVAVFDPALVETALVSRNDEFWKGDLEGELGEVVGSDGVLLTEGERWKRQRRLLQSSFTPERIDAYAGDMVDEAVALVDGWADGAVIDLRAEFARFTLGVLTRSLFDLELDDERAELVRRWVEAMGAYVDREAFGVRSLAPAWFPSPARDEFERATADLADAVAALVEERRRAGVDGDDLLSVLATAEYPDGSSLSPEEITDQLLTFLLAGHETTAVTLTYACWLLAADEEVERTLLEEVAAVLGDRDPTVADLESLSVTEAVAREAMRLYPPFPFLHREPHAETVLGGYRITPGTTIQLATYPIHRDSRWWDEPDAFRPERWLEEGGRVLDSSDERPEYAYFPFGGGPRHCLGMRFAMVELQLTLATLARRVTLERVTESLEPTLRPSLDPGTVEARVRRRENESRLP